MAAPAINGIRFWASAQHQATLFANDAEMATLTDLSGGNRHGVGGKATANLYPQMKIAGGIGGPSIFFQSQNQGFQGGFYTLPASVFTGLTEATLFLKFKSLWGRTTAHQLGPAGSSHHPFDGSVYEVFCADSGWSFVNGTLIGNWKSYKVKAPAGTSQHTAYLDGALAGTSPNRTFTIPVNLRLGGGASYNFGGHLLTAMVIDHALSGAEDAILTAWDAANPNGGLLQYADQAANQSDTDYEDAWLTSVGQARSVGSIRDREMAFLKAQAGAPVNKNFLSFNDLQKALGKPIRDNLWPKDW